MKLWVRYHDSDKQPVREDTITDIISEEHAERVIVGARSTAKNNSEYISAQLLKDSGEIVYSVDIDGEVTTYA